MMKSWTTTDIKVVYMHCKLSFIPHIWGIC
jgi:hypothetical protein